MVGARRNHDASTPGYASPQGINPVDFDLKAWVVAFTARSDRPPNRGRITRGAWVARRRGSRSRRRPRASGGVDDAQSMWRDGRSAEGRPLRRLQDSCSCYGALGSARMVASSSEILPNFLKSSPSSSKVRLPSRSVPSLSFAAKTPSFRSQTACRCPGGRCCG